MQRCGFSVCKSSASDTGCMSSWSTSAVVSRRQRGCFLWWPPPRLRLLLLLLLLLQVGSPHGQVHPHDVASHDLGGEQSRGRPALRRKFTRSAGGVYTHLINIRSLSGSTETIKAAAKLMERSSGDQNTRRCCSRLTQVNRVIMGSRAEPGWADGE